MKSLSLATEVQLLLQTTRGSEESKVSPENSTDQQGVDVTAVFRSPMRSKVGPTVESDSAACFLLAHRSLLDASSVFCCSRERKSQRATENFGLNIKHRRSGA